MFLYEVLDTLKNNKIKFAIVGGYALALHGIVRATVDVDIIIQLQLKDFKLVQKSLNEIGLTSRLPITPDDLFKMRKEYIKNRNLIAWNFIDYKNPLRQVDVLITTDLESVKIDSITVSGRKIPVICLKDLLVMKKISSRPQDLADIEKIKEKLKNEKA